MALRSRLSLAFVFVVLVPVLVGSLVVLIAVPRILRDQIGDRLRTASVSVTDVLAARCTEANQAAQLLGSRGRGGRPGGRGQADGRRRRGRLRGSCGCEQRGRGSGWTPAEQHDADAAARRPE